MGGVVIWLENTLSWGENTNTMPSLCPFIHPHV